MAGFVDAKRSLVGRSETTPYLRSASVTGARISRQICHETTKLRIASQ